ARPDFESRLRFVDRELWIPRTRSPVEPAFERALSVWVKRAETHFAGLVHPLERGADDLGVSKTLWNVRPQACDCVDDRLDADEFGPQVQLGQRQHPAMAPLDLLDVVRGDLLADLGPVHSPEALEDRRRSRIAAPILQHTGEERGLHGSVKAPDVPSR